MEAVKGAYDGLTGKTVDFDLTSQESSWPGCVCKKKRISEAHLSKAALSDEPILFGYCTEFMIRPEHGFTAHDEQELKDYLSSIGDSLVVVSDDEIVKVHVHTNHPGLAFEKGLSYGPLSKMKVDNMREEHEERLIRNAQQIASLSKEKPVQKPYGFIAVSSGEGLGEIFSRNRRRPNY